jgi:hypothetical protein
MPRKISKGREPRSENIEVMRTKKTFTEPKLRFIKPELKKHGDLTKLTGCHGFFGTFPD